MVPRRTQAHAWRLLPIVLVLASGPPSRATAQERPGLPLELTVGGVKAVDTGGLETWWETSPGVEVSLLFPFGVGAVRVSAEAYRNTALAEDLPDYRVVLPSIEWGLAGQAPGRLGWYLGAGMGTYHTAFRVPRNGNEMETALVVSGLLRRVVGEGWLVGAGVQGRRILTSPRLDQASLFLEVGRRWNAPGWIAAALDGDPPDEAPPDSPDAEGPEAPPPSERSTNDGAAGPSSDLFTHGVLRLSELPRALPGWDLATVDLRAGWAVAEGTSSFDGGAPDLLVDGIPVPLGLLGSFNLDRLPLSLTEIEEISASATPGLRAGRLREDATLEIGTAPPPDDGVEIRVRGLAEQPTGDPGPYLFTDTAARNVDKLGTGYSVVGEWRRGDLSGSVGWAFTSDLLTGPELGSRTFGIAPPGDYPLVRTWSPWASLRLERAGSHRLRLGRSTRHDYFFLPALGFEVPARSKLEHAGIAGEAELHGPFSLRYRAWGGRNRLLRGDNSRDLDFDLLAVEKGVSGSVAWAPGWRVEMGAGMEEETFESAWLARPAARREQHAFLAAGTPSGPAHLAGEVELRRREEARGDAMGVSAALRGGLALRPGARLEATIWHGDAGGARPGGFWKLHRLGWDFLEEAGVEVEERGVETSRRESGAEVRVTADPVPGRVRLSGRGRAVRQRGLVVPRAAFVMEGGLPAHERPIELALSSGGSVLVLGAEVGWTPRADLELAAHYRWLGIVEGDPAFVASRETLPTHRLLQTLLWRPRGDLRLALRLDGRSSTRWDAYAPMGRERLRGGITFDVGLEKTFWGNGAAAEVRVGDVFDRETRLHPLGTAPGLAVAVEGSVRVGG